MRKLFDEGCPVVIASRNHRDAAGACEEEPQPLYKRALGIMGNLAIQIMAVWGIWDTQCGFKAFTAAAAEAVFSRTVINGWGFDIEALALARKNGFKIGIVPAKWMDNKETHVKIGTYFEVLRETVRIRLNLMTGKYKD
jgi:dolichyl-phosphate beta-glucosyltransferase